MTHYVKHKDFKDTLILDDGIQYFEELHEQLLEIVPKDIAYIIADYGNMSYLNLNKIIGNGWKMRFKLENHYYKYMVNRIPGDAISYSPTCTENSIYDDEFSTRQNRIEQIVGPDILLAVFNGIPVSFEKGSINIDVIQWNIIDLNNLIVRNDKKFIDERIVLSKLMEFEIKEEKKIYRIVTRTNGTNSNEIPLNLERLHRTMWDILWMFGNVYSIGYDPYEEEEDYDPNNYSESDNDHHHFCKEIAELFGRGARIDWLIERYTVSIIKDSLRGYESAYVPIDSDDYMNSKGIYYDF